MAGATCSAKIERTRSAAPSLLAALRKSAFKMSPSSQRVRKWLTSLAPTSSRGNALKSGKRKSKSTAAANREGLSLREAGNRLSLPWKTLQPWVAAARTGTLGKVGSPQRPLTDLEAEVSRLKRELAEVKLERYLLKKATAYVAKESLPGTR